jgi:hypothetical protein
LIFDQFGLESLGDFGVALSGFAIDLACRSNSELKTHRIVQVLADKYLRVDLLESNVLVAGDFKLLGTTPVSAIENGPGPQVCAFSPGGARLLSITQNAYGDLEGRATIVASPRRARCREAAGRARAATL